MQYTVISGDQLNIDKEIKSWLDMGWKLQGGVSAISSGYGILCFQALVKD